VAQLRLVRHMVTRSDWIYSQTGGWHVGRSFWWAFNVTWPFATLLIYRDELVLRALFWRYTFPRNKIVQIVPYQVLLSPGIKIEHTIVEYPSFIVFWTFDLSDLLEVLQLNAFPVNTQQA
jgi:hypothetical protein